MDAEWADDFNRLIGNVLQLATALHAACLAEADAGAAYDCADGLRAKVFDQADAWRAVERELNRASDRLIASFARDPGAASHLFGIALYYRRWFRRYLRWWWGYDAETDRPIVGAEAKPPPQTYGDVGLYLAATTCYLWLRSMAVACYQAAGTAYIAGVGPTKPVVEVVAYQLRHLSAVLASSLLIPDLVLADNTGAAPTYTAGATLRIVSWVRAHMDLRRNRRLLHQMLGDGQSPFASLLEQLPGAVIQAIGQILNREAGPETLVNRSAWLLEYPVDIRGMASPEASVEQLERVRADLAQRINARAVRAAFDHAGLTPREREIRTLVVLGHQQQDIANILDVTVGSVKKLRSLANKKLGIPPRPKGHRAGLDSTPT